MPRGGEISADRTIGRIMVATLETLTLEPVADRLGVAEGTANGVASGPSIGIGTASRNLARPGRMRAP